MLAFSKCQLVSERTVHEEGYLSTCEKNTGYLHSTWVGAGGGGGEKEKESIGFQTKWPSQLPPLPTLAPEVPQVSLRDPVSNGPLCSERSVHHSQWILSVLLPPDKSNAAKQNNCEKGKTLCGRPTPQPPPPTPLWTGTCLIEFVIQQARSPSLKAWLNFFTQILSLGVCAAAHFKLKPSF